MSEAVKHPLRKRVFELLNPSDSSDKEGRLVDIALITLIALNVLAVILETIPSYHAAHGIWFHAFDVFSVAVFSVEYLLRLWSCVEDPRYQDVRWPRLRYALSPMALIDLLAILPFYLSLFVHIDLRFLRALRLLRIFKLTRYSSAMTMLLDVLQEEAGVLFAGFFLLLILLILASSGAYLVEHQVQPDAFGSIPQSMWWALVTLTTVGYGDVTPVTTAGKIFGGLVTIIGVGMAALPAGILASGLADHVHQRRDQLRRQYRAALEDGVVDAHEEAKLEALRKKLGLSHEAARRIRQDVQFQHDEIARVQNCTCPSCGHEFKANE